MSQGNGPGLFKLVQLGLRTPYEYPSSAGHPVEPGSAKRRFFQLFNRPLSDSWLPKQGDTIVVQPLRGRAVRVALGKRIALSWELDEGAVRSALIPHDEPDEEWAHGSLQFAFDLGEPEMLPENWAPPRDAVVE